MLPRHQLRSLLAHGELVTGALTFPSYRLPWSHGLDRGYRRPLR